MDEQRSRADRRKEARAKAGATRKVTYKKKYHKKQKTFAWWRTPVLCVCACILVAVVVFSFSAVGRWRSFRAASAQLASDYFYPGITVDGVDLSGMTLQDALTRWEQKDQSSRNACNVILDIDDASFTFDAQRLGYSSNYKKVLRTAYSQGRHGTFSQRNTVLQKLLGAWARDYNVVNSIDQSVLKAQLEEIAGQVNEPAVAATITGFNESDGFTFDEGKDGRVVDVHDLMDAVNHKIAAGGGSTSVDRTVITGGRSIEDLKNMFGMIAQCKTSARSSSDNRLTNLRVATRIINGMRIEPGEVFSFNGTLGKRTRAKGYKGAPALSSGTHTSAVGGGICQVSTTLFNAVAKSGLEIVERHPHSIPSVYIAIGLDATVNWPNQDFRFKNTSEYPIYISAKLTPSKHVHCAIYGRLLDNDGAYRLKGVVNQTYRPRDAQYAYTTSLPTGTRKWVEERYKGYKVTTYRGYFEGDKEISREVLFTSLYPSSAGKCLIGQ